MAESTLISWANAGTRHGSTFNPWIGCIETSEGCRHCYAKLLVKSKMSKDAWGPAKTHPREVTSDQYWQQPARWEREARTSGQGHGIFCGSLCDWAEDHPDANALRPRLFDVIRESPSLRWLLLTKRAERIRACLPKDWGPGWPNVWLGVSIESPKVQWRLDELRAIPAAVRFVSYEPALASIKGISLEGMDWVIVGAESGLRRRAYDDEWAREALAESRRVGAAFFFKQASGDYQGTRPTLDGMTYHEFPTPRALPTVVEQPGLF